MREHVRVGGVGQRAVALAGLDAAPQLIGLARPPDRAEVVVVLAQVAHRLRSNAAGPDVPVGRDLRRGHTRHARDHLALLAQRPLDELVVLAAEGLSHLRHAGELLVAHALEQRVDGDGVLLRRRRDPETDGVELYALLGDLRDVGVRLEFTLNVFAQLWERVDVEVRDDGVDPDGELLVAPLQLLEARIRLHRVVPVAAHPADLVVLQAHAVEREVDDHLGLRRRLQHTLDTARDRLVLNPVGGNVDDPRPAVAVRARDHLREVLAQRGLTPAEREPVGSAAERLEHAVPLRHREVIVGQEPHVAGLAAGVTAVADAHRDVHRQSQDAAGGV